ncbi:MAG: peptide deformylase [Candidatus Magasanikbacteria bacterium]|nr:peptide deformylase [Candidatus Magasanikbacteria bacterium]
MTKLVVITHPNEILRKRSDEVDRNFILKEDTQNLIKNMIETMHNDDGVGLAAPQIGKNIRIVIIGKDANPDKKDLVLINPRWNKLSRKKIVDLEGCLSIPKTFGKVKRYNKIQVTATNEKGEKIEFEAEKLFARVIQHEVDHLDGVLFIDKARDVYEIE